MAPILEKRGKRPPNPGEKIVPLSEEIFLDFIFSALNELNTEIQGRNANCFDLHDKIDGFERKLNLWKGDVAKKNFDAFPATKDFLWMNKNLVRHIQPIILEHLAALISKFDEYFPLESDPRESYLWITDPFLNFDEKNSLSIIERDQLVGMFAYFCSV